MRDSVHFLFESFWILAFILWIVIWTTELDLQRLCLILSFSIWNTVFWLIIYFFSVELVIHSIFFLFLENKNKEYSYKFYSSFKRMRDRVYFLFESPCSYSMNRSLMNEWQNWIYKDYDVSFFHSLYKLYINRVFWLIIFFFPVELIVHSIFFFLFLQNKSKKYYRINFVLRAKKW